MLNVVMLSVVMLSVVMLSVIMLNLIMLNVVMLSVVILSVVASNEQLMDWHPLQVGYEASDVYSKPPNANIGIPSIYQVKLEGSQHHLPRTNSL